MQNFRHGDSTIKQLLAITHNIYTAFEEIPREKHGPPSSIFQRLLIEFGMMAYFTSWNATESLGIFCHYLVTF